jgi:hypothetical protein
MIKVEVKPVGTESHGMAYQVHVNGRPRGHVYQAESAARGYAEQLADGYRIAGYDYEII